MHVDVAIAGASFAGLGLAYHLRESGLEVLLIDEKEIGDKRTSACGMPLALANEYAPEAVLNSLEDFYVETMRVKRTFRIPEKYCVIDYEKFCKNIFKKSNAKFLNARVSGVSGNKLTTSKGDIEADYIIDCTGWRRVLAKQPAKYKKILTGVEITAPIGREYEGKLNFFLDKRLMTGYCWVFPIGKGMAHVGVGGYCTNCSLNDALMKFLEYLGIEFTKNELAGGVIPCTGLGKPIEGNIFFVGDSAQQVLPLSAEGIRTSLHYAKTCAGIIRKVSEKEMPLQDGLRAYERMVNGDTLAFRTLKAIQRGVLKFPQLFTDTCVFVATIGPLNSILAKAYLSIAAEKKKDK